MKRLLLIIILLSTNLTFAQFRVNHFTYFTISSSIDPTSSIKEKGLDFVGEFEFVNVIYAKVGIESFAALTGGYTDIHSSMGINFTSGNFERIRYYTGFRMAKVYRGGEGAFRIVWGLEGGIDVDIADNIFIGLRGTLDKRYDQEILLLKPENIFSGFIRIGYKWYYKNRRP